jgi:hypothetical protein
VKHRIYVLVGRIDKHTGSLRAGAPRACFVDAETGIVFGPVIGEARDKTLQDVMGRAFEFLDYLELEMKYEDVTTIEGHVLLSLYKEWVGR